MLNQCATAFSPTIEPINVTRKKILKNVAGSLKTKIPTKTVPTAPMPVQTAYAVPIGKVCVALIKRLMLAVKAKRKPVYQRYISFPVVSFTLPKQ